MHKDGLPMAAMWSMDNGELLVPARSGAWQRRDSQHRTRSPRLRNAHGGVPYAGAKDVLQQAQLAWREPWLLAFLHRRRRRPVHDLRLPQAQLTRSAAVLWTHPAWRVGRRGGRGALALVMEETGSRRWRAE